MCAINALTHTVDVISNGSHVLVSFLDLLDVRQNWQANETEEHEDSGECEEEPEVPGRRPARVVVVAAAAVTLVLDVLVVSLDDAPEPVTGAVVASTRHGVRHAIFVSSQITVTQMTSRLQHVIDFSQCAMSATLLQVNRTNCSDALAGDGAVCGK